MGSENDLDAIRTLYDQLGTVAVGGDAEGYAALYDDRGVLMPPNAPAVGGRNAIREWARDFFRRWALEVSGLSIERQEATGTTGFCRYRAVGRYVPKAGGEPVPFDQKYLDALVRDPGGAWKIAAHMWSSNIQGPSIWV